MTALLAKLYVRLVVLRLAGLALLGVGLVVLLAFPGTARAVAFGVGVPALLLLVVPWFIAAVVGARWGRRADAWRAAGQFTTFDIWPQAVDSAHFDARRWAKRRIERGARTMVLVLVIALVAAVTLGDWSISLR